MLTFLHSCHFSTPFNFPTSLTKPTFSEAKTINSPSLTKPTKTLIFPSNSIKKTSAHVCFCYKNGVFDEILDTHLSEKPQTDKIDEIEELELRGKPSPLSNVSESDEIEPIKPDEDEVLAPFLKFFKPRDSLLQEEEIEETGELKVAQEQSDQNLEGSKRVLIEYYEPQPGDFVVGVVVSGNENKLDVNIGADLLGTMLTKDVLPLYDKEMENLLCDVDRDAEEFLVRGKIGIVRNNDAISSGPEPGRPVVDTGTVLFAEVLGRTLSGRPLLSTRRFFRRIAWHRVRQIHQLNEPIEIIVTEWNTGGLLTRIEGLRAFLPKGELMNKVNSFTELKENVGRRLQVQISRIDETTNDLILSEREAWEMLHLQVGTLLEGTVRKIFPYGAQIRIGESNRSGLLHISKITRSRIVSVSELLAVDEKVKALVVKSMFPGKISLSIADLESESGLFMSNKEKVFAEAEEMAKKYKQKLPSVLETRKTEPLAVTFPFDNEKQLYANWNWFKFERDHS